MNRLLTLSTAFNAIHDHDGHRSHGHRFVLRATVPYSASGTNPTPALRAALTDIATELHETDLGAMLPGAAYDVTGLAAHFYERLAGSWRNLERVSVDADEEGRGTAERTAQ